MAIPRERHQSSRFHKQRPRTQRPGRPGVPGTELVPPYAGARRVICWLAPGVAAAELIGWVVAGLTIRRSAFFWLPLIAIVLLVPLVAVAFGLCSPHRGAARATAVAALAFAVLIGVAVATFDYAHSAVVDDVFWLAALVSLFAVYFAAFLAELAAFGRRWPRPPAG